MIRANYLAGCIGIRQVLISVSKKYISFPPLLTEIIISDFLLEIEEKRVEREIQSGMDNVSSGNTIFPYTGVEDFDLHINARAYQIDFSAELTLPFTVVSDPRKTEVWQLYFLGEDRLVNIVKTYLNVEVEPVEDVKSIVDANFKPEVYKKNRWILIGLIFYLIDKGVIV